jgi:hypothetical protein
MAAGMMDENVWKLCKWAMGLTMFGYVPMVLALKVLRRNGAFDAIGQMLGIN